MATFPAIINPTCATCDITIPAYGSTSAVPMPLSLSLSQKLSRGELNGGIQI